MKHTTALNKTRKTTLGRRPVSPLKKAKLKADRAFAQYIRDRDQQCKIAGLDNVRCGGSLQCMHLITRGVYSLRFDEVNALGGCAGHHIYYTMHPQEWVMLLQEHFPDRWEYIQEHRNEEAHYKQSDYEELARFYTRLFEGF